MTADAAIALNRFGLGARPGEPPPTDPRGWLRSQADRFDPRPAAIAATADSATLMAQFARYREGVRAADTAALKAGDPAMSAAFRQQNRNDAKYAYALHAQGRLAAALTAPAPFAERLVHFWANHFAVSVEKLVASGVAGTLEFEAIRPRLFGTFGDMLLAVETHPAMLLYLDQARSIGPGSVTGSRAAARANTARKVGLNENLGREILELHTLGVDGGYAQDDVQELARALTGWSVGGGADRPGLVDAAPGAFVFQPDWHEPGKRVLLGKTYRQPDDGQARAMLADLAVHPATAQHLATKLARHFAGDVPPPALVARLTAAHLATGGDLKALYGVLVDAPEIWATPLAKFKTPWDWTVSMLRGLGVSQVPEGKLFNIPAGLGQPTWKPGSPAGWDDIAASWAAPDALLRRVEVAQRYGQGMARHFEPRTLAAQLLPGTLSAATAQAIARADSPGQGLALLLVAPEFLRR